MCGVQNDKSCRRLQHQTVTIYLADRLLTQYSARCLSESSAPYSGRRVYVSALLVARHPFLWVYSQSAHMDAATEKECAALAAIFQQIISDMKVIIRHCIFHDDDL